MWLDGYSLFFWFEKKVVGVVMMSLCVGFWGYLFKKGC